MTLPKALEPSGAPIRVLIADDSKLARMSLRSLIEDGPGVIIVGEAASGAESIALCTQLQPDIVLLDIRIPDMDGIIVTERLRSLELAARVIIITMFDHTTYLRAAMRAGAWGYVLKDISRDELLRSLRTVAAGKYYVTAELGPLP